MIATVSPNSLRQTRWQVYRDLHRDVANLGASDSEALLNAMMREPDYAEGVAAFTEKRPPSVASPQRVRIERRATRA